MNLSDLHKALQRAGWRKNQYSVVSYSVSAVDVSKRHYLLYPSRGVSDLAQRADRAQQMRACFSAIGVPSEIKGHGVVVEVRE